MKGIRASEFKAFWENDCGIKLAAWRWTPQPRETQKPIWCLCYDGFFYGHKECPLIKDGFETLSDAIEYGETVRERRWG